MSQTNTNNLGYEVKTRLQGIARRTIIVILNYKTYELTLELIKAIRADRRYAGVEIVVVDNCSPGRSADVLKKFSSQFNYQFFANDNNAGYAAGNNIALRWAFGQGFEYALVINNDVVIDGGECEGSLLELAACLKDHSEYAVIGPKVLKPSGEREHPVSIRGNLFDFTLGYPLMYSRRKSFNPADHLVPYYRPQGCCMMLRLKDLDLCGYLDESTFLYCEEEILAERLIRVGKRCGYCKDVAVVHNHSVTVRGTYSRIGIALMVCKSFNYYLKKYRQYGLFARAICLLVTLIVRTVR